MTRGCFVALGLLALLAGPAAAQEPDDEGGLDIGMPVDDAPPDTTEPTDEPPPDGTEPVADEPPVRDPAAAKALADGAAKIVKKGDKLKKRKKLEEANAEYQRALVAYERSFEMNPVASVLYQAAVLHGRLERWPEAVDRYQRALAETEIPLDAKTRTKAQAGLDDALTRVAVVTLNVIPEGASITLDGADIGVSPLAKPLVLTPGEHGLILKAEEYIETETKLVVEAGSESERTFELKPVPVVVEPPRPPPPPPEPPPPPPAPSKLPWLAGAGATGLFTIGAVVTGVMALGKHSTFTDESASADAREAAQSSGRTLSNVSDIMTTCAVLSAGFTVYYYLRVYTPKLKGRTEVVPTVDSEMAGLVITGSF